MSASRERRERARMASEQPVMKETKKKKKKLSEGWILAISVILVVAVVFGAVLGIRHYQQNQTVLTAGGKDVSVKEFNYFYNAVVNNISSNASYLGIDSATPLDEQTVQSDAVAMMSLMGLDATLLEPYKKDDSYDITWAGYFALMAKESAAQAYTLYQKATEAGFTVTEEIQQTIDNELMNAQLYASIYGYSTDDFIENSYGRGCNEENYREYLKVVNVGYAYAQQLTYSDAEVTARYEESKEDYDVVSYLLYTVKATDFMTQEEIDASKEATDEEKKPNTEAMAEAKAAAEAMEKEFDISSDKVTAYADHVMTDAKTYTTEDAATWMFETAKAGDVKLFEDAKNETYYVVKLLKNDNYASVNALMIYIANDAEEESHEGHDHAEGEGHEGEEAEIPALKSLQMVQTALESDASEENFRKLAEEHNDSQTLEITDAYYATILSNISKEALAWASEGQQKGAYATFGTEEGTFVLYFMGEGKTHRTLSVTSTLINEWVEKITDEAVAACNYDHDAAMNGGVGLVLGTQNG